MEHLINEAYAIAVKIASVEHNLPRLISDAKDSKTSVQIAQAGRGYLAELYQQLKTISNDILCSPGCRKEKSENI